MQQTMYYFIQLKDPFIPVPLPNTHSIGNAPLLLLKGDLFVLFFNCYDCNNLGFSLKNLVFYKN